MTHRALDTRRIRRGPGLALTFALACGLLSLCLTACGARQPGEAESAPLPPIRVATSGDYAPFSTWPDDEAEPRGFEPELVRRFARAQGRRIEWVRFRWPDLLDDARAGAFDIAVGGITIRPERSIAGTFGVPLAHTSAVVLVRSASLTLDALDAPERKIAVNRGGHLERVARARFPGAVLLPTSPNEAVPARLAAGEVDAVVTDTRESPIWRSDQPDWLQLGPLTHDRKAIFAAPGHAQLVAELDTWLLGRRGRRTLLELQEDVLGIDPIDAHASFTAALVAAIDERLALMPDVARYKQSKGLPIEVPDREQVVLDTAWRTVAHEAARRGVTPPDEAKVRAFYGAQIDAAKQIQRRVAARAVAPGTPTPPDLDTELRPALIRIGDRMARLIVMLGNDKPHRVEIHLWDGLTAYGLDDEKVAAIREALAALTPEPAPRIRTPGFF